MGDADMGEQSAAAATLPVTQTKIFGATRTVANSSGDYTGTEDFLSAEVDFGAGYAAGNARVLTLTILNDMIRRIRQNGGNPKVMITGYDTIQHISDLLQSQERFSILDRCFTL